MNIVKAEASDKVIKYIGVKLLWEVIDVGQAELIENRVGAIPDMCGGGSRGKFSAVLTGHWARRHAVNRLVLAIRALFDADSRKL